MDSSAISLDLYPAILHEVDFQTLQHFKTVNKFCNYLYKEEMILRNRSPYPFGETSAYLKFIVNDIFLERIYCIYSGGEIEISFDNLSMPSLAQTLHYWFYYSFTHHKWILTGKIIKSVIRINNKLPEVERIGDILTLTFAFKNKKSYLFNIE